MKTGWGCEAGSNSFFTFLKKELDITRPQPIQEIERTSEDQFLSWKLEK